MPPTSGHGVVLLAPSWGIGLAQHLDHYEGVTSHGLGQREHDADRWIAAIAIRLGVPLVSNDGILEGAPGLVLECATES
jgi:hypothetical protein